MHVPRWTTPSAQRHESGSSLLTNQDQHPGCSTTGLSAPCACIPQQSRETLIRRYPIVRRGCWTTRCRGIRRPGTVSGSQHQGASAESLTAGGFMNTSCPRILQSRVLVNRFPARIRNRVDFPATPKSALALALYNSILSPTYLRLRLPRGIASLARA